MIQELLQNADWEHPKHATYAKIYHNNTCYWLSFNKLNLNYEELQKLAVPNNKSLGLDCRIFTCNATDGKLNLFPGWGNHISIDYDGYQHGYTIRYDENETHKTNQHNLITAIEICFAEIILKNNNMLFITNNN